MKGKKSEVKKKIIKKMIASAIDKNQEDKWGHNYIARVAGASITDTPTFDLINGVFKGTNRNQRVANRIKLLSINLSGYLKAQTNTPTVVRMTLIRVLGTNGVAPVTTQIYSDSTVGRMHLSDFDLNNRSKYFTVIWDHKYVLQIGGGGTNLPVPVTFNKKFTFKNSMIDYNDNNGGNIGDIVKNAYYLCIVTDQNVPGNTPDIIYQWQVVFEDA